MGLDRELTVWGRSLVCMRKTEDKVLNLEGLCHLLFCILYAWFEYGEFIYAFYAVSFGCELNHCQVITWIL